ncbi:MAG: 4-hydroxy-tetrahydrodipicolinate reductase [Clostridia bacterium]|nr:4-hydroxy-tetrahydrodipicolinate reductase [Clostridia bacterium]
MINLMLFGYNGKMGHMIREAANENNAFHIVAGVDIAAGNDGDIPVYTDPFLYTGPIDVIIDFSHPDFLGTLLQYASERNVPVVIATTGFSDEQKLLIESYSQKIPVFHSANMSVGIYVLTELAKQAQIALMNDYDTEIIEMHHHRKLDAPSGTALAIADALKTVRTETEYVYDRHSVRKKRSPAEIGISSVRGGTIVGEHTVLFAGEEEQIEITHTATSRKVFAVGSLRAAAFMHGKSAGFYSMQDLMAKESK